MKKFVASVFIIVVFAILSGCAHVRKAPQPLSGGLFKSFDRGETWQQKNLLATANGMKSIRDANIKVITMDPQDNNALYIGTENRGLFYSYNGGEYWEQPAQINSGTVNDIVVDPHSTCTVYAAYGKKIMKTIDCNRSWFDVFIDPRPKTTITSMVIDPVRSSTLYITTDVGEVIKSIDGGNNWSTMNRFTKAATQIVVNGNNPQILYVMVLDQGVYKSTNGGNDWYYASEQIKKVKKVFSLAKLYFDNTQNDGIYLFGKYGVLRSDNGGQDWTTLTLVTQTLSTDILTFSINPDNGNHLYYGASTLLYRSVDRGESWSVKKISSQANVTSLVIDPVNPSIIYVGTKNPPPKK